MQPNTVGAKAKRFAFEFGAFGLSVAKHWRAFLCFVFLESLGIWVWQSEGGVIPHIAYWIAGVAALLFAAFFAWRDQHDRAARAEAQVLDLEAKRIVDDRDRVEKAQQKREAQQLEMELSLAYDTLESRLLEVGAFDPFGAPEPVDYNENETSKDAISAALTAVMNSFGSVEASYFTSRADFKPSTGTGINWQLQKYRDWRLHCDFLAYRLGRLEKIIERNPKPRP